MAERLEVWIPGIPKPGGSKRAFMHPHTKRIIVKEDCAGNKNWRESVKLFVSQQWRGAPPLTGTLRVEFHFVLTRPAGHFGSGKNAGQVKASAPRFPGVKPDTTKLVRSTEDALKGVVWRDDAQIVTQTATKRYGEAPGCRLVVEIEN